MKISNGMGGRKQPS